MAGMGTKSSRPSAHAGLNAEQVRSRKEQGLINTQPPLITKSTGRIWREHLCTFFNAINLALFIALILVDSYNNLMFMGVVLSNLLIGVIQELRSKHMVEKLSLLNAPHAKIIRDGQELKLAVEEIVLDDVLRLTLGDQIPTDCELILGSVEVDESLLTGESEQIRKQEGDKLLSGSVVVSGECRALVEHVGEKSYAAKLTLEAKKPHKVDSKLMRSLRVIIRFTGGLVLPLGLGLFLRAYWQVGQPIQSAVQQTAGSMLGMIPSGLMLLTSVSLAAGVIVLSRKNVLVQESYAIETLARVDMLCLDKTGTLTTGSIQVSDVFYLDPEQSEWVDGLLCDLVGGMLLNNATSRAMHERFSKPGTRKALSTTPFSSARRYSAASFENESVYLGALDAVCPDALELKMQAQEAAREGYRVLVLAHSGHTGVEPPAPKEYKPTPVALVLLQDEIRPEAADMLEFFTTEGVEIKLISGDDPATVSHIAQRLHLPGAKDYIDVSSLYCEEEIIDAATRYTVFGRVSPQQKRLILHALQQKGHTVAMTGDGVNDLLALREADCSIALYTGSDAARQASHLVLLTNDFSVLPGVVMEGRRVINNITRTASLFLVKTIFSFLLTVSGVLFGFAYPFQPIQLTLISSCTVGIPSLILSLEPNRSRTKGSFLKNVMTNALPGALTIYVYSMITTITSPLFGFTTQESSTLCVYLAATAGLLVLLKVCLPFERRRGMLFFSMVALFFVAATLFNDLFGLAWLRGGEMLLVYVVMAAFCYPLLIAFTRVVKKALRTDAPLSRKLQEIVENEDARLDENPHGENGKE